MLTLGQKVLLHLGTNFKWHLDDSERIMILILHTRYIMITKSAGSIRFQYHKNTHFPYIVVCIFRVLRMLN